MLSRFEETWFYAPLLDATETMALSETEAQHAIKVLRLPSGTEIIVTNGLGSVFLSKLVHNSKTAHVTPLERIEYQPETSGLGLALCMLRGRDLEIPAEGVCEFPLGDLFLIQSDKSSEFKDQNDRLVEKLRQKSLVALKQAKKAWLTRIHPPKALRKWRENYRSIPLAVAHPGETSLPTAIPENLHVLIGPEGGFSPAEIDFLFQEEKAFRLSLGPTRLRAIHAPLVAMGYLIRSRL